jgi:N-methylhydantoinase A
MLVNVHTAVIGLRPRLDLALLSDRAAPHAARKLFRSAWFEGGFRQTPVYQRASLPPHLVGPAIIEQLDCTTVLEPGNKLTIDKLGNLLIEV